MAIIKTPSKRDNLTVNSKQNGYIDKLRFVCLVEETRSAIDGTITKHKRKKRKKIKFPFFFEQETPIICVHLPTT